MEPSFGCLETEAATSNVPHHLATALAALAASVMLPTDLVIVGRSRSTVPQHEETRVRHRTYRTLVRGGVLVLGLGLGGCGGSDSPATPLTPSPLPPQAPAPSPSFPPGTLRGVSLSGVVYELTPTGRRPIPKAYVYCEACSE